METIHVVGGPFHYSKIIQFFRKSLASRMLSWLLLFALLNLTGCCHYYRVSNPDYPTRGILQNFERSKKTILIISGNEVYSIEDMVINRTSVSGNAKLWEGYDRHLTSKPDGANRYKVKKEAYVVNLAHIYVDDFKLGENNDFSIYYDSIKKIEYYEPHKTATFGSHFLGFLLGTTLLGGIFLIYLFSKIV